MTDTTPLLAELRQLLGADAVIAGDAIDARYLKEYFAPQPAAVCPLLLVKPRTTAEVAAILRRCNERRQPVVLQGGMTGLSGGALPQDGEVVLSLERLRGIEELDQQAGTMTLWAGTPLQEAQEAAAAAGFLLAIDLGARGSCHVAGNVATNAGGNRVIRYGMAREQVLRLNAAIVRAQRQADVAQKFNEAGSPAWIVTPDEMKAVIAAEIPRYQRLTKSAGLEAS